MGLIDGIEVAISYHQVNGSKPEVISAAVSIDNGVGGKTSTSISVYQGGNKQIVLNGLTIDINIGQLLTAIEHEILGIFESFNN
jgi:hypothetical protein